MVYGLLVTRLRPGVDDIYLLNGLTLPSDAEHRTARAINGYPNGFCRVDVFVCLWR